jgi:hypothetical protein
MPGSCAGKQGEVSTDIKFVKGELAIFLLEIYLMLHIKPLYVMDHKYFGA